ncbi:MCE family protein [Mycolicibacterium vaccae]|jgi:phospholipid/cholesterol/gamma-HCH transport system substrate-binding protein|uniref:Virulence factor Mce family protein n=1 Tax=Mycolicibacterium vaccae ATCC 25954 TaxID=1194972 RepID=K0V603_MYCVA|nr:MCE family protein [Mycolicibacterium vaccae]ANI40850.1 virulence factor Mce family protein [Mycolicibacterium vaccae 95051]EJZ12975.1 virulence factor Mce family protein [Mycolicibacterium vaccae ATCC 25954]
MNSAVVRPLLGLTFVAVIAALGAGAAFLFRGGATDSVPAMVLSPRAGLVLNPDAKVKFHGVQVGKVSAIESMPDGQAAIHLAIDAAWAHLIPADTRVSIDSTTVFGAKSVSLVPPREPSAETLEAGQVLNSENVTVEINTVFERLTSVLSKVEPAKLSQTLGAIATAFDGRGERFGQALVDFDAYLAEIEPSLPSLSHDIEVMPEVLSAYADAAPDLLGIVDSATRISESIVEVQSDLDTFLISAIGLADTGSDVIGSNRAALTDVLQLLVPTTDLTNEYNTGLTCALQGLERMANVPPSVVPGVLTSFGLTLGAERYRYPENLPKVAATGGPHCFALPDTPPGYRTPQLITDIGVQSTQYGNHGIVLNADGLKQLLFGSISGPPRNSAQIGPTG